MKNTWSEYFLRFEDLRVKNNLFKCVCLRGLMISDIGMLIITDVLINGIDMDARQA